MLKNSPLGYDFGKFFSFVHGLEKILENYAGGSGSLREAPRAHCVENCSKLVL